MISPRQFARRLRRARLERVVSVLFALLALFGRASAIAQPVAEENPRGAATNPHEGVENPRGAATNPHEGVENPHSGGSPHGSENPHASLVRDPRSLASADASSEVPAGSVRVRVEDASGRPVPFADVLLGTMVQGGSRKKIAGRTDAQGVYTFANLAKGTGQAYRVNVPVTGATYNSTPFQLPEDRGYAVRIVRLPTTQSDQAVLQVLGQVLVEIRDERLHITQQARLVNLGASTYVFPSSGKKVRLPKGFLMFEAQKVMTDQRIEPIEDEGFALFGSLPPGEVTLNWAFDLPARGSSVEFDVMVPWKAYAVRVLAEAPAGLNLDVAGFEPSQLFEEQGHRVLVSQLQRKPDDAPLRSFRVSLTGLPAPGPGRWVAVALALGFLGLSVVLAFRTPPKVASNDLRQRRREALLREASDLEVAFAKGEVGPSYRSQRRDELERELALLLRDDAFVEGRTESPAA